MTKLRALIWNRRDFRESSRLVTLLTRERGKLTALAKGAHRANSNLLGRLDLLNLCEITLAGRGMPLLSRATLLHEPRGLRQPSRFLIATHLVEIFDTAFLDGRADPDLFDLLTGALTLIERAPATSLPLCAAGIELKFLRTIGLCGALTSCAQCGAALSAATPLFTARDGQGGVFCDQHRPPGSTPAPGDVLTWLARLADRPGRDWPTLPVTPHASKALTLLGPWLSAALEFRPRSRGAMLRAVATTH